MLFFFVLSTLIDSFYFLQKTLAAFRILFNMVYLHFLLINGDRIFCEEINFINPDGEKDVKAEYDEKLKKLVKNIFNLYFGKLFSH